MKRYIRISIAALILICFFVILSFSIPVLGGGLPNSLNLDLSKPPQKEDEVKDPVLDKYNEVMREISISDEAAQVVEQIKDAVQDVKDLTMDVLITEIRGQRNEQVFVRLLASVEKMVARAVFLEPSALRGIILVADQGKMETRTFKPVNNQIVIQTLEDVSKEALSAMNVGQQFNTYFDFSEYAVEVLEVVEKDGISDYLLQVKAINNQDWNVRVQSDTWIPYEIAIFEADVAIGKMNLSDVVLDPNLDLEKLMELPKVKEVRM